MTLNTLASYGLLTTEVHPDEAALGVAAAKHAAEVIRGAIEQRGDARVLLATGNSQLAFLTALRETAGIEWSRVELFHLDEYIGIDADHPASFRRYLHQHFVDHVSPRNFHEIAGNGGDPQAECDRYAELLRGGSTDLSCIGIGENGHLAFNDPPYAKFEDPELVKIVELDEVSRRQQVGEGHFPDMEAVPTHAITLTIPALLNATSVQVVVPEARKAAAVKAALLGPLTEECPASVLRNTPHARLFLDAESAGLLP
ncbi:MAG: glucosamine-6-phosphate deaminase [Trueperaceae bacterium]